MSCKVSVIVPVHNSEKYLKEMSQSLCTQTLMDMEFIFVDDCSTDKSLDILSELEKNDPDRVLIIKLNENQGPGGARNVGIQYASGEYIGFVDSDDFIKKEMFEELYKKAVSVDYDIVESGYFSERKNSEMMLWNEEMEGKVSLEKRVKMIMSCGFLWTKLFKRDLIINSGINFITKIPFEDVDFLTRIYLRAESIGVVNKSLYHYRDNRSSFSNKRNGEGALHICNTFTKKYIENMKKEPLYNIYRPIIEYVVIGIWFDLYSSYVKGNRNGVKNKAEIIKVQLKQYIPDYEDNMFFVEKAKYDEIKYDFICIK